jgi:hypothetical protein
LATYCVIDIETVLIEDDPRLPWWEREASLTGVKLYVSLMTQYSLIVVHDRDQEQMDHWLRTHGFGGWTHLHRNPTPDAHTELRRTLGALDLWVTGNAAEGRHLLREGMNVLLFSQAGYRRREWQPDYDRILRPWDAITDEVAEQMAKRTHDKRLGQTAPGRFESDSTEEE